MSVLWTRYGPFVAEAAMRIERGWAQWGAAQPCDAARHLTEALQHLFDGIDPGARAAVEIDEGGRTLRDIYLTRIEVSGPRVAILVAGRLFADDPSGILVARLIHALLIVLAAKSKAAAAKGAFLLSLGDDADRAEVGFCGSRREVVLIPDPYFMGSVGYIPLQGQIRDRWVDWSARAPTVFWRGSTTGRQRPREATLINPLAITQRTELCHRLRRGRHRAACDVGISSIAQITDAFLVDCIRAEVGGPAIPRVAQIAYRYVLDIDGNTNAWGLLEALHLGACVIRIASAGGYRQWYHDRLVHGRNCLSVAADLTDLEEIVGWALASPDRCAEIAERGRDLALSLTYDEAVDEAATAIAARLLS